MIIAIDETGDFQPNSELNSFFVAVILEQQNNKLNTKKAQFLEWLKTIPKEKFNDKNEIKGSDLNENELYSFTEMVFTSEPCVKHQVVFFSPSENPEELMKTFKKIEISKIERLAELSEENGKNEMAEQYRKMAIWHKNSKKMHYPHFMKLILLRSLINKAFNTAVGVSILYEMVDDKKSENLLNLEFKIDQDFVRGRDATIFWKELLRNTFISYTNRNPIPTLDAWETNGHPFLEKYKRKDNNKIYLTELFKKNCNFKESDEHWEIQIADITGIIINRFHNRNKAQRAYLNLNKCLKKNKFTKIILNESLDFSTDPTII